jgi:2-keto-3-deoxy-L-fuconate dehydrogenase
VLLTQPNDFMGPAVAARFADEGAEVIPAACDLTSTPSVTDFVEAQGRIDVLVANLMRRNTRQLAHETLDGDWHAMFDTMVHPLHRLVCAVLPQMLERQRGKIVVMGSANGLRGTSIRSAYSAARGAQIEFVRSVGIEVAPHGVNINLIAQNYVSNPTSYPPEVTAAPDFAARLAEVPIGRVAKGDESAALALFLASEESNFLVGHILPFAGGWA